jgi:acetylornithine deacetylase/succinyl-diaminopimelate desuccinylase-like protein
MAGDPFDGRLENGRVYGRGAVDTKASLGVILAMLEASQEQGAALPHNLIIAATVDEEAGATGAPAFASWLQEERIVIDQLLVAEPTLCHPVHGHKGVCRLTFQLHGTAAHSSQPHLGKNAITAAAHLILALEAEHQRLQQISSPLGAPALTVSLIHGGQGINVVPDSCRVSVDRRLVVGEGATEMIDSLRSLAEAQAPLPVSTEVLLAVDAFYQPPDTPWLRQLADWCGQEPAIAPYGANAWAYPDVARECVVLGPGSIDQAHSAEEWVSVDELEKLAGILARWWGG